MDVHTADLPVEDLALPDVDPSADLDAQRPNGVARRTRASNRSGGRVEPSEEPVTRGVELVALVALELTSDQPMMPGE